MKIEKGFVRLPTSAGHNCFACSPRNASGLRMAFFCHENAVYSRVTIPAHLCGWNNVAHGGVVSTILDETMGWAAMYLLKRVSLTQSLTVEFQKPVTVGEVMEAESGVLELRGKREAVLQGTLIGPGGKVYATSRGTFQTFAPEVARRLGIADEDTLEWFHRMIATR